MSVLLFIAILVVLIVGHEFGHLLVAKWSGMRVPEFGIGFPPRLWGKSVGGTLYSVNAIPFGGFVKIVGEDGDADDPESFTKKPKRYQAATLFAGPFANVVLGFAAFWLAFMVGVPAAIEATEARPADARVVVTDVLPESPAALAGLMAGDTLIGIESPADLNELVAANERMTLIVERGEERFDVALTPVQGVISDEPERYAIGVGSALVGTRSFGFFSASVAALEATAYGLVQIVIGLATLIASAFSLSASIETLTGPVGIASMVGDALGFGWGQVFALTAVISLNLAILNLLPFPALDGGRLLFLAIEAVRGRAIRQETANAVNTFGFALLIALMLVVTWNDIARLIA